MNWAIIIYFFTFLYARKRFVMPNLRYVLLASDVIWEMLPDYKEHDPPARDALDVYISHRTLMEQRAQQVETIFNFWLVIN